MTGTATAAGQLAAFAAGLRYEDIPPEHIDRARQCVIDTVGACLFGSQLPWGRIAAGYARHYGSGGASRIVGTPHAVAAPMAALANGVFAHAFELDSLRKPGAGVHPGATLLPPALAIADELELDGKAVLAAFVAGCEVMFRIGAASRHSSESLGFHAPGLTGPFGAAVAAGRLLGLDAGRLTHALGIAGSLCSGLLAFTKAGNGAMVKRLHMGRAAEAGILAARLALEGYEGPDTILEGKFGFLEAYCRDPDPARLTDGLGKRWETATICLKRYPCHITAHTPVQTMQELRAEHGFDGSDIAQLSVLAGAKVLSHHAIHEPKDIAAAQYSVPFCTALAAFHDPGDPRVFSECMLSDARVTDLCRRIRLGLLDDPQSRYSGWASTVIVRLKNGREFTRTADDFKGTPASPLAQKELREKFLRMAADFKGAAALFDQLTALDAIANCRELALAGAIP